MNICIASYRRAKQRLERGEKFDALVSICTLTDEKSVDDLWPEELPALWLMMYDVLPHRKAHKGLPTGNDILKIIDFAKSLPKDANVLVHCAAGRSRSPAAGIIMLAAIGMGPRMATAKIFVLAPKSNPNGWMLKLADIILDWDPRKTDEKGLFDVCESYHRVKW